MTYIMVHAYTCAAYLLQEAVVLSCTTPGSMDMEVEEWYSWAPGTSGTTVEPFSTNTVHDYRVILTIVVFFHSSLIVQQRTSKGSQ